MDELLVKYNDYMRLVDYKVEYKLENGQKIEFPYKEENFPHLIGLHKLKDLQLIQFWQDRNNKTVKFETLIRRIKNSTFIFHGIVLRFKITVKGTSAKSCVIHNHISISKLVAQITKNVSFFAKLLLFN